MAMWISSAFTFMTTNIFNKETEFPVHIQHD